MVERKGDIPNLSFRQLTGGVDTLRAAVELHRPRLINKYGQPTDKVSEAKWVRCGECQCSVPSEGCRTWKTAYPDGGAPAPE